MPNPGILPCSPLTADITATNQKLIRETNLGARQLKSIVIIIPQGSGSHNKATSL